MGQGNADATVPLPLFVPSALLPSALPRLEGNSKERPTANKELHVANLAPMK